MPKYTFEKDGQKYSVTSDTQPTKEQLLSLVAKQQSPEKKELVKSKPLDEQALSLGITPYGLSEDQLKESIKDKKRIDQILDKISDSGYDSLTKTEKDYLFKVGKNKK